MLTWTPRGSGAHLSAPSPSPLSFLLSLSSAPSRRRSAPSPARSRRRAAGPRRPLTCSLLPTLAAPPPPCFLHARHGVRRPWSLGSPATARAAAGWLRAPARELQQGWAHHVRPCRRPGTRSTGGRQRARQLIHGGRGGWMAGGWRLSAWPAGMSQGRGRGGHEEAPRASNWKRARWFRRIWPEGGGVRLWRRRRSHACARRGEATRLAPPPPSAGRSRALPRAAGGGRQQARRGLAPAPHGQWRRNLLPHRRPPSIRRLR